MNNNELNTEQIILEAAEAEFLEKGYGNAKMMAIAKRAEVSHSMLHYYFRSKENLFQTIFLKKSQIISQSLGSIFEQSLSFSEIVRRIVEVQFDFVRKNPKLPHFILNEILSNKENRSLLFEILSPKAAELAVKLKKILADEAEKGTIRPINMYDFMMNIIAMNVSTFIVLPIVQDMAVIEDDEQLKSLLNERKENNVRFVLNALRP